MFRLALATGEVHAVAHASSVSMLGLDGIALYDGSIVGAQNGISPERIVRTIDETGMRVPEAPTIDRNLVIADEPTIGSIVADSFVYVANSQWEKYSPGGKRVDARALTRPVLLRVPLR